MREEEGDLVTDDETRAERWWFHHLRHGKVHLMGVDPDGTTHSMCMVSTCGRRLIEPRKARHRIATTHDSNQVED